MLPVREGNVLIDPENGGASKEQKAASLEGEADGEEQVHGIWK